MSKNTEVLIVGAGPSGLMAAIELRRRGIDCRLIDKKDAPTQTSNAVAVHARSLEMWDNQGIINKVKGKAQRIEGLEIFSQSMKRLASMAFVKHLKSTYPCAWDIPQNQSEAVLIERLGELGLQVERSTELVSAKIHDDGISCEIKTAGAETTIVECHYVIASDGFHSTLRNMLKVEYEGKDLKQEFIMIDTPLNYPVDLHKIAIFFHPEGLSGVFPMKESARIIVEVANDKSYNRENGVTRETFIEVLKRRWSFDFQLGEARWMSHFFIHERLAKHYQSGRVFLVGDAAHAHSPAGGQGMNTGMQDAYNLGWKLAAVIKGELKDCVLDTYEPERRPVAQNVLKQSTAMTVAAAVKNPLLISLRNFFVRHVASRRVFQKNFANFIGELSYHYRQSPLSLGDKHINLRPGDRSPIIHHSEHFVLYVPENWHKKAEIEALIKPHTSWIELCLATAEQAKQLALKHGFCLVRPDMYIACQGCCSKELAQWLDAWVK